MATLQELQDRLAFYLTAEENILTGAQEVVIGGRRQLLADLPAIQAEIRSLNLQIARAQACQNGLPITHSRPVFGGRR